MKRSSAIRYQNLIRGLNEEQIEVLISTEDPSIIKEVLQKPDIADSTALSYGRLIKSFARMQERQEVPAVLERRTRDLPQTEIINERIRMREEIERLRQENEALRQRMEEERRQREEQERRQREEQQRQIAELQRQITELQQLISRVQQGQGQQQPQPQQGQTDDLGLEEESGVVSVAPPSKVDYRRTIKGEQYIRVSRNDSNTQFAIKDFSKEIINQEIKRIAVKLTYADETGREFSSFKSIKVHGKTRRQIMQDIEDEIEYENDKYGSNPRGISVYGFR